MLNACRWWVLLQHELCSHLQAKSGSHQHARCCLTLCPLDLPLPPGGSPARVEAACAIVEAGVAVVGHVGLTPQSVSAIGERAMAAVCRHCSCAGTRLVVAGSVLRADLTCTGIPALLA